MTSGRASAPASSANLGPGFDMLALALDLRCNVEAQPADDWRVTQDGRDYEPEVTDFVRRAVSAGTAGTFHLTIENAIPRGRGLGSSAAVAIASSAAAMRAGGREPDSQALFDLAAAIDGHPDNAAAAVYGGLVVVGRGVVRHLEFHPDLRVVVGVPEAHLSTDVARSALASHVDREVVTRSLARLAFLLDGMRTGDVAAFSAAGGDELHEEPRRSLSPVTARLIDAARDAGALHAAWSGAGPTAIAFAMGAAGDAVQAAMDAVFDGDGEALSLDVDVRGWR